MRECHARSTINIIVCAGERAQLLFLTDIRAGKQMRERGPRGKANGGKGVLAGKQMLGSLGFDIFSSPAHGKKITWGIPSKVYAILSQITVFYRRI